MASPETEALISQRCADVMAIAARDRMDLPGKTAALRANSNQMRARIAQQRADLARLEAVQTELKYAADCLHALRNESDKMIGIFRGWYTSAPNSVLRMRPEARAFLYLLTLLKAASEEIRMIKKMERAKGVMEFSGLASWCADLRQAYNMLEAGTPGSVVYDFIQARVRGETVNPMVLKSDRVRPIELSELGFANTDTARRALAEVGLALQYAEAA